MHLPVNFDAVSVWKSEDMTAARSCRRGALIINYNNNLLHSQHKFRN